MHTPPPRWSEWSNLTMLIFLTLYVQLCSVNFEIKRIRCYVTYLLLRSSKSSGISEWSQLSVTNKMSIWSLYKTQYKSASLLQIHELYVNKANVSNSRIGIVPLLPYISLQFLSYAQKYNWICAHMVKNT